MKLSPLNTNSDKKCELCNGTVEQFDGFTKCKMCNYKSFPKPDLYLETIDAKTISESMETMSDEL